MYRHMHLTHIQINTMVFFVVFLYTIVPTHKHTDTCTYTSRHTLTHNNMYNVQIHKNVWMFRGP